MAFAEFPVALGGWLVTHINLVNRIDHNITYQGALLANASGLSVTSVSGSGNDSHVSVLYEDLNGDMMMIRGTSYKDNFEWRDISLELRSAAPEAILRSPFSSGVMMADGTEIIFTKSAKQTPLSQDCLEAWCLIAYQTETFKYVSTAITTPTEDLTLVNANNGATYLLSINQDERNLYVSRISGIHNFKISCGTSLKE